MLPDQPGSGRTVARERWDGGREDGSKFRKVMKSHLARVWRRRGGGAWRGASLYSRPLRICLASTNSGRPGLSARSQILSS